MKTEDLQGELNQAVFSFRAVLSIVVNELKVRASIFPSTAEQRQKEAEAIRAAIRLIELDDVCDGFDSCAKCEEGECHTCGSSREIHDEKTALLERW